MNPALYESSTCSSKHEKTHIPRLNMRSYSPFGNIDYSKGSSDNSIQFTGKEIDPESGLTYFGARYYNPVIGRWISRDHLGGSCANPQSLNRYTYCLNNPLTYIDADGRKVWVYSRTVIGENNHLFAVIDTPGKPKKMYSLSGKAYVFKRGKAKLHVGVKKGEKWISGYKGDVEALTQKDWIEKEEAQRPSYMDEAYFDNQVEEAINELFQKEYKDNYPTVTEHKQKPPKIDAKNSNTIIDEAINKSGGRLDKFKNAPLQKNYMSQQQKIQASQEKKQDDKPLSTVTSQQGQ